MALLTQNFGLTYLFILVGAIELAAISLVKAQQKNGINHNFLLKAQETKRQVGVLVDRYQFRSTSNLQGEWGLIQGWRRRCNNKIGEMGCGVSMCFDEEASFVQEFHRQ